MRLSSYFYRVTDNLSVGPPCGKLELFCLQKVVDNVVYCDSVVFRCQLHSSSDVMLETHTWGTSSDDHHINVGAPIT